MAKKGGGDPQPFVSDPEIHTQLQVIAGAVETNAATLVRLTTAVESQNGRLSDLEEDRIKRDAVKDARAEWDKARDRSFRWLFGAGLGAAGLISGVVFSIANAITGSW